MAYKEARTLQAGPERCPHATPGSTRTALARAPGCPRTSGARPRSPQRCTRRKGTPDPLLGAGRGRAPPTRGRHGHDRSRDGCPEDSHFTDPPGSTQDLVRVPGWHGHRGAGQELHVQARFLSRFPDGRLCDVLGALDMAAAGQPAFKAGMPDQGSQPRSGLLTEHEHARCRLLDHHASSIGLTGLRPSPTSRV